MLTILGYAGGTLNIIDVAGHIAILSAVTALYLAYIVREERERRDSVTIGIYFTYAAALAFITTPEFFDIRLYEFWLRLAGGICLGLILIGIWYLYIKHIRNRPGDKTDTRQ